jgi:hypothetical protein
MIKKFFFDSGQKQQIIITSQLPLGPYWNLNMSYGLDNWGFYRGG